VGNEAHSLKKLGFQGIAIGWVANYTRSAPGTQKESEGGELNREVVWNDEQTNAAP
jgi:hypothetical protein